MAWRTEGEPRGVRRGYPQFEMGGGREKTVPRLLPPDGCSGVRRLWLATRSIKGTLDSLSRLRSQSVSQSGMGLTGHLAIWQMEELRSRGRGMSELKGRTGNRAAGSHAGRGATQDG